tara:strand:+ start:126 stop:590 length:465 start_codon:yes stop_codon:yes gene_type:complete
MAKILKVYNTVNNGLQEFTVNEGITYAEVINLINGTISNLTTRGRNSKVTYELGDAKIADADLNDIGGTTSNVLFVGPKKMDSGVDITPDTIEALEDLKLSYKSKFEDLLNQLFSDVTEEIEVEVEDQLAGSADCGECDSLAEEARKMGFGSRR